MGGRGIILLVVSSVMLAVLSWQQAAMAQALPERARQKQEAEKKRADLQQRLTTLKRDINQTTTAKDQAEDALAESETAISRTDRTLRELAQTQGQIERKLVQLGRQQDELTAVVNKQQAQLSTVLRGQYVSGNEDRLKLLLSGDNPNRITRELQYMGYVSQAQAQLIAALRANLQTSKDNQAETQRAKAELAGVIREEQAQKQKLEQEKGKRASLLVQLSSKLSAQRKEAGHLQRDEQRLSGLVDKLAQIIEEQKKAEKIAKAAREKRRKEQLAKARAERARRAAQQAKAQDNKIPEAKTMPSPEDAIDGDEAPADTEKNDLVPESEDNFGKPFASLRGQLRLPLKGELVAKFGSPRGQGPNWKGLFIHAPEGTEVRAVAAGRVVYADWLRGFGNLLIIDHGNQYMTIYGNNQSVLKHAGDVVKMGEVIASAGNSGGNEESGLYFEMRHQGRAFDPLGWVITR